ncbi:MAG: hypothetical protein JST83_10435 [Bacteroidetes bacterium]|nr:hypothetical protein [Bacteroidota bacterium]
MSAATGNTYAEKWTLERTLRTLATIDQLSQDNTYLYLGQVLSAAGTYDDVWRYWRSKWRRRPEILDLMKQIMQRFESRIFVKMANKEIPERVGMFALRHHYGWCREKEETTQVVDNSYIDQELVTESAPVTDQTPAHQLRTATPSVKTEAVPYGPIHDAARSRHMQAKYNQKHPDQPLREPLPYYKGAPPKDLPAIKFENGYFLGRCA